MARKPAPWRPRAAGWSRPPSSWAPSAFSTVSRPSAPRRAASASDSAAGVSRVGVVGPGEQGAAAALDVERQLRRRPAPPARRPCGRAGGRRSARCRARGVRRRRGWPGRWRPGRRRPAWRRRSTSLKVRSRSMAPGGAELGGAQPVDEVAAPAAAGVLEGREHLVGGGEPARLPLADDGAADDHAVPVEQALGGGVGAAGRVGVEGGQQRPAARRLGRAGAGRRHPAGSSRPCVGGPAAAWCGGWACRTRVSARSGVRVSLLTRPAQTRSHRAAAQGLVVGRADRVGELAEEPRAAGRERVEDGLVELAVLEGLVLGQGERRPGRRGAA